MAAGFHAQVGSHGTSMRAAARHKSTVLATTASLVLALATAPGAIARASLDGAASAPLPALGAPSGSSSSAFSLQGLPTLRVQAGSLLNVEAAPLPANVEVAGLPAIETPPLPVPEAPSTPPLESPALPVEVTTPTTTSTPAPAPAGSNGSPGTPKSSSSDAGAHAAGTTAKGPAQTPTSAGAVAPNAAHGGRPARSGARRRARKAAGSHATGKRPARGRASKKLAATTGQAAPSPAPPTRSPAAGGAHRKASTGNPLEAIGRHIPFPVPVPDWSRPIILVLLLLAIWFAVRSRLATVRARRLEGQRASMLSDLGDMQAALVPAIPERLGGLSVSVAYEPADGPAAGGDFYDLFALDPGKVAIVLGDVVGHGRRALTQAALTRYTLRAYLQAGLEPRAALALAGSVLARPGEKRFATVVVAIHDSASGRLTYACAGHPPPIAIGFDLSEPITVCCSAPICCDLPTGRRQTTISLPAEGQLCFFSDGLPEARIGDDLLGRERLSEIANELGPSTTAPALLERVRCEASATSDDMVACLITPGDRASAEAAKAGAMPTVADQVEELEVAPEMLGEPRVHRFLGACGLDDASIAALLAQAGDIAARRGTALLRIERPRSGEPTAAVGAGRAMPDAGSVAAEVHGSFGPALALSSAR